MSHEHTTSTIRSIFSDKGYGEEKLVALATLLHITGYDDGILKENPTGDEISSILSTPKTAEELNTLFQRNYFQKYRGTGERQQAPVCDELTGYRDSIVSLCKTLGYINPVKPSHESYDIAFVFGASQAGLVSRIDALKSLMKPPVHLAGSGAGSGSAEASVAGEDEAGSGITIRQIFILAGDRALWPDREDIAVELFAKRAGVTQKVIQEHINTIFTYDVRDRNDAKEITAKRAETINSLTTAYPDVTWPTEADLAKELADIMLPGQVVGVIDAKGKDGKRPDTLDTVQAWKDRYEDKITTMQNVLAVSNQPFIPEQMAPLGTLDPRKFTFDIVGEGCNLAKVKPESLLSAFAGCFYKCMQRDQYIEKEKSVVAGRAF